MPRLPYPAPTGVIALIRLLPTSNTDKDTNVPALRRQQAIAYAFLAVSAARSAPPRPLKA
ncbi:hypothetical protein LWC34_05405 [Kibdelosporangium philippinense]|uniref:Uncharacterized protein n=1 Tax=Kibdelosporangium philippinense TaxID=211113 RepID=A0ABS8Z463_9PSEU|nr:hypothetical protein [Kibdelosporangium philippinense]MCE7002267.1 hypothetical protein [Kibdelosporangium philippinense]